MAGKYVEETAVQEIFKLIKDYYARKDGYYVDLSIGGTAGNLQSTINIMSTGSFDRRTTCGDESTIDGDATIQIAEGNTVWEGNTPIHSKLTSIGSSKYNNFNKAVGYAIVPQSGSTNFVVSGTNITTENTFIIESPEGVQRGTVHPTNQSNTKGIQYLNIQTPNTTVKGDHIRLASEAPADLMIAFVWSGYNVDKEFEDYSEQTVQTPKLGTSIPSALSTGLKSIVADGKRVVVDKYHLTNGKVYDLVGQFSCGSLTKSSLTSRGITTDKNYSLYSFALSGAVALGALQVGNSNTFKLTQTALATSGTYSNEMICVNTANTVWCAVSFDHDHSDTYTQDDAVVDEATFTSERTAKHRLYTQAEGVYTEATSYTEGETYYYRESLGGQYIIDQLNGTDDTKIILFQKRALTYAGSNETPVTYSYAESDFGQEWTTVPTGFNCPILTISYPLDIKATVQTLQKNYISNESFDELCTKIESVAGLKITRNGYDEAKGHQTFDVVDTKETIVNMESIRLWNSGTAIPAEINTQLSNVFWKVFNNHDNNCWLDIASGTGARARVKPIVIYDSSYHMLIYVCITHDSKPSPTWRCLDLTRKVVI